MDINQIQKHIEWEEFYSDKFNWNNFLFYKYQKLSESFIREFKDKIDWFIISRFQKLSENFIKEFQDKIVWNWFKDNNLLSEEFKEEMFKKYGHQ